jgi:PTS system nitrogen regulatory IIA component
MQPAAVAGTMQISDYLTAELVLPALAAAARDEVMEALAARLAACHPEIDAGRLVAALHERERQVSTALVDGVAIPHARVEGLTRMIAALGRSAAGVDCGSHDGKPTHLFLLLVVPADRPGAHLKLLATASRLLTDGRCRARLMDAPDAAGVLDALREAERRTVRARAA